MTTDRLTLYLIALVIIIGMAIANALGGHWTAVALNVFAAACILVLGRGERAAQIEAEFFGEIGADFEATRARARQIENDAAARRARLRRHWQ